jgi:hypothetical protein
MRVATQHREACVRTLSARVATQHHEACVRTLPAPPRSIAARWPRLPEAGDRLAGHAELLAVDDDA